MLQRSVSNSPQKSFKKDLIGSVQRALRILELLAHHPLGLNAKQISLKLSLNISTCYHLVNTLEHDGYIVKDPETSLFRLSGKIGYTAFAQISSAQLVKQLSLHVRDLQEITGEAAYLSIWDGEEITVANIVEAANTVQVKSVVIGYTQGNHASALGKAILAHLTTDEVDAYFATRDRPAYTSKTITNLASLKKYLTQVRNKGYALDYEEFMTAVHCIGAPIFDANDQVIASIAVSLPTIRSEKNTAFLIAKVKQLADSASRTLSILGYVGSAGSPEKSI